MQRRNSPIRPLAVVVAALPYLLLGYPWYAAFRDSWFAGGGLTVEQLMTGPSYGVAFSVAAAASVIISWVLATLIVRTGSQSAILGAGLGALIGLGVVGPLLATQYVFEARSVAYFLITAGHPAIGLIAMGAILGAWHPGPSVPTPPRP